MTKKEVKNENINNEVKEEETIDVQEETLEEEVEEMKESKFKKGINLIRNHKREIAIGVACIIGGVIGYALNSNKDDSLTTAISGSDTLSIEMDPEEPVDVEVTSEDQVSEEA